MPLFRVTVKRMKNTNGIRLEPGMTVDIPSNSFSNPVTTNGGQVVIKKAGALNMSDLDVQQIR